MDFEKIKETLSQKFGGVPLWLILAALAAFAWFFGKKKTTGFRQRLWTRFSGYRTRFRTWGGGFRKRFSGYGRSFRRRFTAGYSRVRERAKAWYPKRRPAAG